MWSSKRKLDEEKSKHASQQQVLVSAMPFTSLSILWKNAEPKPFCWPEKHMSKINSHVDCVGNVRSPKSADRESHCDMQVIDKLGLLDCQILPWPSFLGYPTIYINNQGLLHCSVPHTERHTDTNKQNRNETLIDLGV